MSLILCELALYIAFEFLGDSSLILLELPTQIFILLTPTPKEIAKTFNLCSCGLQSGFCL